MRILEAAVLYYAVVFGAGFLLGQLEQTIFRAAHRGTLQPALRTSRHRAHPGTGRPDSGGDTACTDRWSNGLVQALAWSSSGRQPQGGGKGMALMGKSRRRRSGLSPNNPAVAG